MDQDPPLDKMLDGRALLIGTLWMSGWLGQHMCEENIQKRQSKFKASAHENTSEVKVYIVEVYLSLAAMEPLLLLGKR